MKARRVFRGAPTSKGFSFGKFDLGSRLLHEEDFDIVFVRHAVAGGGPFQATGFKVGEVTHNSAIVWTRLTANAKANPSTDPTLKFVYIDGKSKEMDLLQRSDKKRVGIESIEYSAVRKVRDIRYA